MLDSVGHRTLSSKARKITASARRDSAASLLPLDRISRGVAVARQNFDIEPAYRTLRDQVKY